MIKLYSLFVGLRRAAALFLAATGGNPVAPTAPVDPIEITYRRLFLIIAVGSAFCSGLVLGCAC